MSAGKLTRRPIEEISKMIDKSLKAYEEVGQIIARNLYGARSEEGKELREEQYNIELLVAILHRVMYEADHPDERFRLNKFKSCTIIIRHFGEPTWSLERIYKRSTERIIEIQKAISEFKDSEEYVYMKKLSTVLAWVFDQIKDSQIGLHFCWRMFPKRLKDDCILRGKEKDDFNTTERIPLEDKAYRALSILEDKKTDQKLENKFSFMKEREKK